MSYSEKKNIKIDPFFCLCFLSLLCFEKGKEERKRWWKNRGKFNGGKKKVTCPYPIYYAYLFPFLFLSLFLLHSLS